jgi:hypothetical protein
MVNFSIISFCISLNILINNEEIHKVWLTWPILGFHATYMLTLISLLGVHTQGKRCQRFDPECGGSIYLRKLQHCPNLHDINAEVLKQNVSSKSSYFLYPTYLKLQNAMGRCHYIFVVQNVWYERLKRRTAVFFFFYLFIRNQKSTFHWANFLALEPFAPLNGATWGPSSMGGISIFSYI